MVVGIPVSLLSMLVFIIHAKMAAHRPMIAAAVHQKPLAFSYRIAIATGTTAEPMILPIAWYTPPPVRSTGHLHRPSYMER